MVVGAWIPGGENWKRKGKTIKCKWCIMVRNYGPSWTCTSMGANYTDPFVHDTAFEIIVKYVLIL